MCLEEDVEYLDDLDLIICGFVVAKLCKDHYLEDYCDVFSKVIGQETTCWIRLYYLLSGSGQMPQCIYMAFRCFICLSKNNIFRCVEQCPIASSSIILFIETVYIQYKSFN